MQEQLISFKTARLAKEKGFQELVSNCYYEGELFGSYAIMSEDDSAFIDVMDGNELENHNHIDFENRFSAPTQSFLQKWLREKYKLEVHVSFNPDWEWNDKDECLCVNKGYRVDWGFVGIWKKYETESYPLEKSNISTYEEALEVGLQEALKLIK